VGLDDGASAIKRERRFDHATIQQRHEAFDLPGAVDLQKFDRIAFDISNRRLLAARHLPASGDRQSTARVCWQ
jgi:hypothetical protein